jgi:hypothetical protein
MHGGVGHAYCAGGSSGTAADSCMAAESLCEFISEVFSGRSTISIRVPPPEHSLNVCPLKCNDGSLTENGDPEGQNFLSSNSERIRGGTKINAVLTEQPSLVSVLSPI